MKQAGAVVRISLLSNICLVRETRTKATDSTLFTCKFYKDLDPADLGIFIIEGNKISAFVPMAVAMGEGAWYGIYP